VKELRPYQQEAVTECWKALVASDEPVLLMASVGSGKSLMLADILLRMQKLGKRALCLVNNAELVRNNCATFIEQGGEASIYCAALKCKDSSAPIVFGTPQTILNGINKNEPISHIKFNIIVVDEAHAINYLDHRSIFVRLLRHYKQEYPLMRVLGATGTNFRFKGTEIVGSGCLFRTQVGNITTEQLIKDHYLIDPNFEVDKEFVIDFTKVKVKRNGKFDQKELEQVITESARLTELICKQIIHIMESQKRFGIFIFATTKKHAFEILSHLPENESAIILGETPQDERTTILDKARKGKIKYLVNISIISVGVDVPAYDTLAYLRPTESLVLLVQTMGRALRLSPTTDKVDALVLDFAGNLERHRDWDNPILLKALRQTIDHDKPRPMICPRCLAGNTENARRCVGERIYNQNGKVTQIRCDYYFEFKECTGCGIQNDITSRHCRSCHCELIDPNKKLTLDTTTEDLKELEVLHASYNIAHTQTAFRISCSYRCRDNEGKIATFYENYTPSSDKARHVFYGQFIKKHCNTPSDWYPHISERSKMEQMLEHVNTPSKIMLKFDNTGYRIKRKVFENSLSAIA
jgi:DNA repair protein RadD